VRGDFAGDFSVKQRVPSRPTAGWADSSRRPASNSDGRVSIPISLSPENGPRRFRRDFLGETMCPVPGSHVRWGRLKRVSRLRVVPKPRWWGSLFPHGEI
jgi:hypothetical protein